MKSVCWCEDILGNRHLGDDDEISGNNYKSYCSTVHFHRITSVYQPTNAHIISHKTLLKPLQNHILRPGQFQTHDS